MTHQFGQLPCAALPVSNTAVVLLLWSHLRPDGIVVVLVEFQLRPGVLPLQKV